jgi:hypothetical protein
MASKPVEPQLGAESFSCPHCGALSHQTWFKVFVTNYDKDDAPPRVANYVDFRDYNFEKIEDEKTRERFRAFVERLEEHSLTYHVTFGGKTCYWDMANLVLSRCYSCDGFAIWLEDRLLYPAKESAIAPHEEMPEAIKADFNEAASIVDKSPRGAAALLRLCIQKLMPILSEKGKNLNDDIASLVQKGLEVEIQKALDIVRVTGNESVHPGQIDLNDDKSTAIALFELVNLIVERRIAAPKRIAAMFDKLPPGAREQIEKRDAGKK